MISHSQIEAVALKLRELTIASTFVELGPLEAVEQTLDILAAVGITPEDMKEKVVQTLTELSRQEELKELERFLG